MQNLKIFRKINDNKALISVHQVPDEKKGVSNFDNIRNLLVRQKTEDVIGLGSPCNISCEISQLYGRNGIWYSYEPKKIESNPESLWTQINFEESDSMYGQDVHLAFEFYSSGYVLQVKCSHGGFFGTGGTFYFRSMGRRNARCDAINSCRRWKTKKALLKWCQENQSKLEHLSKNDWRFSAVPHNQIFEEDEQKRIRDLSENKRQAEECISAELDKLLEEINTVSDKSIFEEKAEREIPLLSPDELTDEDLLEEIIYRMETLDLTKSVIRDYKKTGRIFKSEFAGMLYDLNDREQKAVDMIKKEGYIPYHVITTHTTIGEMIDVLYASKNPCEWSLERPDSRGWMTIHSCGEFEEIGSIQVRPVNGGLIRSDLKSA